MLTCHTLPLLLGKYTGADTHVSTLLHFATRRNERVNVRNERQARRNLHVRHSTSTVTTTNPPLHHLLPGVYRYDWDIVAATVANICSEIDHNDPVTSDAKKTRSNAGESAPGDGADRANGGGRLVVTGDDVAEYYLKCFLPLCAALIEPMDTWPGAPNSEPDPNPNPNADADPNPDAKTTSRPPVDYPDPSRPLHEHTPLARRMALRFLRRQQMLRAVRFILARRPDVALTYLRSSAGRDVRGMPGERSEIRQKNAWANNPYHVPLPPRPPHATLGLLLPPPRTPQ